MIVHFIIISTQCAAVAAFLILWYFWVKKRIETAISVDHDEKVLFPFRYFSWLLIGLVLVSCLLQIHFIRVSAAVHEKLAAMTNFYGNQEQSIRTLDELKTMLERLRKDIDANSRNLRAKAFGHEYLSQTRGAVADLTVANVDQLKTEALAGLQALRDVQNKNGFRKEARASSAFPAASSPAPVIDPPQKKDGNAYSMRLSRTGRVMADKLSIHKRPAEDSPVVEQLDRGQEVKVTEKRLSYEDMWFRIVTPSGRTGWVDHRQLKLDGNS
jgi:hypothetical protein